MRHVLTLTICGALAAPIAVAAQPIPDIPAAEPPVVATESAPTGPALGDPALPPAPASEPTPVQGVTVEAEDKDKKNGKIKKKAAVTVGGVLGGLAGAAGGPVGKIAGSLVGKTIAKTVVGGKKDKDAKEAPTTEVAQAAAPPATDAVATAAPAETALPDPAPTTIAPAAPVSPPADLPPAEPAAATEPPVPPTR